MGELIVTKEMMGYCVRIKIMKMKKATVLLLFLLLSYTQYGQKAKYITDNSDPDNPLLVFVENGKKTVVKNAIPINDILYSPMIEHQGDYNFDGYLDVLVAWTAGGGTCCESRNQLFFFDGKKFYKSEVLGYALTDKTVTRNAEGKYRFMMREDDNEGEDEVCSMKTIVWGVKGFRAVKLLEIHDKFIQAPIEIRSSIFHKKGVNKEKEQILYYDLDNDGKKDKIICKYWDRWDSMFWHIAFANGKEFDAKSDARRIGVLSTKTNGVYDLVHDCGNIFKWNGKEYKEVKK